ncbi:hypothetical protein Taro_005324 [Colocasia esculenta]|uniref:Uncharacterized protein n=1 Tax=Colocasia esculenta TaxID=4460 RepID=A0A843TPH5_COLES|nr:hypothetical protein [Colocasia esculenta]
MHVATSRALDGSFFTPEQFNHLIFSKASIFPGKIGRVEELLVAEELWNDHKKPFFFPFSSATTCTNHSLEVDQRFHVERFV